MTTFCALFLWWLAPAFGHLAHSPGRVDSLRFALRTASVDTVRVLLLNELAYELTQTDPLATIGYGKQALQLAQELRFRRGEGWALVRLGSGFREAGNYPAALQIGLQGLRLAEALRDPALQGRALNALGYLYWEQGNSRPALAYFFRAKVVAEKSGNVKLLTRVMGNIGNVYEQLQQLDSALFYLKQGFAMDAREHDLTSEMGDAAMLGNVYAALGNPQVAQVYYRHSIRRAQIGHVTFALCRAYLGQARLFERLGGARADSALHFAKQALAAGQQGRYPKGILQASQFLATAYAARGNNAAAFRYLTLASATRENLFGLAKMAQVQALDLRERMREDELADQQRLAAAQRRQLGLGAALLAAVPLLLLLWRNNRLKQQANQQLYTWSKNLAAHRDALRTALADLKTAQDQLMRREKLAFLGELTAGIAHELQNPLNFVANFAGASAELAAELLAEVSRPVLDRTALENLAADVQLNQEKIRQHGQRASSIVKTMLEHSRNGAAPRLPTDLNALVEEALMLAYQNLCGSDHAFRAYLHTRLDPELGPVPVVAQDLSRVLLNVCANALYAVRQRALAAVSGGEPAGYEPTVVVSTRRAASGQAVEIRVRDNGTGIPKKLLAKIFQPFFTTKPPGEGTGLGLSLSYGIVTQTHGGTLTVASKEGRFTQFTISLPCEIAGLEAPQSWQLQQDVAIG
ncbi:tetratricopeptide repeat-containing sensor histidine kinase [Hymenobacter glaciei]|uniref:tetratricopeptide repeat-containing sensor histidine kinase n=1 Tax=Hymenobacter glaciei TaxID=877209 RepID=UPI0031E9D975